MSLLATEGMPERAFTELREGRFETAVESFTEFLAAEPEEAKAYQGRALASFQLKDWASAISDFKRAGELDPGDLENGVGLAMSLAMDHKIYEAIGVLETLLADHPDFIRAHVQLGLLYYRLGVITKGHEEMDRALACSPSLAERRRIEQFKSEEQKLDKRRYYRADFEALRRARPAKKIVR